MFQQLRTNFVLAGMTLLLAGCIVDTRPTLQTPTVPAALAVTAADKLTHIIPADGVQIYQCKADQADASKFVWSFVAPEATLFDEAQAVIGVHYGGPTWEGNDGSKVVGEVKERADTPDADAIPWLLLNVKSTEGDGIFGNVTAIHRVETVGGKAPAIGCDADYVDEEVRVPYTAVYYFYTQG